MITEKVQSAVHQFLLVAFDEDCNTVSRQWVTVKSVFYDEAVASAGNIALIMSDLPRVESVEVHHISS